MSPPTDKQFRDLEERVARVEQTVPAAAPAVSRVWVVSCKPGESEGGSPVCGVFVDRGQAEQHAEALGVPALVESMEVQR